MTRYWFQPNITMEPDPRALDDLGSLFSDSVAWGRVLSRVHVLKFAGNPVNEVDMPPPKVDFLTPALALAATHKVEIAVTAGGPLGGSVGAGTNCTMRNGDMGRLSAISEMAKLQKVYDRGSKVDYLTMDSTMARTILNGEQKANGCDLTPVELSVEIVAYMLKVKETYPDIKIVLTEQPENWPYARTPGGTILPPHSSVTEPNWRPEFTSTFETVLDACEAAGITFDAYHVDCPYEIVTDQISTIWFDADDWFDRIFHSLSYAKSRGMRVGIQMHSLFQGDDGGTYNGTDAGYKATIDAYIGLYQTYRNADPTRPALDDMFVASFYRNPRLQLDNQLTATNGQVPVNSFADTYLNAKARFGPRRQVRARRGVKRAA